MVQPRWEFEKVNPRSVRRDPFEAEFFTGEEETEEVYGRTDSLVREAIQNSLDARIDDRPAEVRFALSQPEAAVPPDRLAPYLEGLTRHMQALGNEVLREEPFPPMTWLAIEDFNTRGLTGDPARSSDPDAHPEREAFYWFWRNVGRSGKSGTDRGRWGLGKTVFPATSRINALFGLTVRYDDRRALLMGQAVTKSHDLDGRSYEPEAFFHACESGSPVQMPVEDEVVIRRFIRDFRLRRTLDQPGLSVVVPYPFPTLKAIELLRSVIVHYFVAILRGELIVRIEGPGIPERVIDASTIRELAHGLEWTGRRAEKKHAPPPLDLVERALSRQKEGLASLKCAGDTRVPEWNAGLFPDGLRQSLIDDLQENRPIALRVPLTVELKAGGIEECFFDVFIERDPALQRSEDYFVREGMTIAGISTLGTTGGYRALVLVDHDILSNLLGDAEGPAHNDWNTGESRPDRTYVKWKRRITFVKQSAAKIISLLSPPPAGLNRDLLKDVFWLPSDGNESDREDSSKPGRKKQAGRTPLPPPAPPPPRVHSYRVDRIEGGFRVSAGCGALPQRLRIRAAYDIPEGNPLKNWSRFDFEFGRAPIEVRLTGGTLILEEGNVLECVPSSHDFELRVTGFDRVRDLFVDVRASDSESETT